MAILRARSVTFKEFMELALYDPEWGYYSGARRAAPGTDAEADYFTSVSVGSCFADLLAIYLHDCWEASGAPKAFTLVEQGGNTGTLAADLLQVLSANFSAFYAGLRFLAVESSPRAMSDPRLEEHTLWTSLTDLGEVAPDSVDLLFCNELLDAFPVHRVTWGGESGGWREVYLAMNDSDSETPLATDLGPLSAEALETKLAGVDAQNFEPGYTTEIRLGMRPWLDAVSRVLKPGGRLLVIDYGLSEDAYFSAGRREGTLQAYHRHQRVEDLLARPGEQDLTAHVNFSQLQSEAEEAGLRTLRLEGQQRFLTQLAKQPLLKMEAALSGRAPDAEGMKWIRQFQQLTAMGPTFQVMEFVR